MSCDDLSDRLGEWVVGAMPPEEAEETRAHVEECVRCAEQAKGLRALEMRLEELPLTVPRHAPKRSWGWLMPLAAAGVLVGILALIVWEPAPPSKLPAQERKDLKDLYGDPLPPGAIARMGTVRLRDGWSDMTLVAFSPNGKVLATGSTRSSTLHLWEMPGGRGLLSLHGEEMENLSAFAFAPDGKTIAAVSWFVRERTVRVWKVLTGKKLVEVKIAGAGGHVAFSPDARTLAVEDSGVKDKDRICIWDVATGKRGCEIKAHDTHLFSLAFSPDGRLLASAAYDDPTIRFWDTTTGKESHKVYTDAKTVSSLTFSSNGKRYAWVDNNDHTAKRESTIRVADCETGKEILRISSRSNLIYSLGFSPDGKILASLDCPGQTLRLWDSTTGKALSEIPAARSGSFSFSPDRSTIAIGGEDIRLWNLRTGEELLPREGHRASVVSVSFSRDEKEILSVDARSFFRRWEPATGKELNAGGMPGTASSAAVSPDGEKVAIGNGGGWISLQDIKSGKELLKLNGCNPRVSTPVSWITFSPDGKRLASCADCSRIWDVATGAKLLELEPSSGMPLFSPDGRVLASPGTGGIVLRDAATGQELVQLKGGKFRIARMGFSSDARMLIVGRSTEILFPGYSSKNGDGNEKHGLQIWEVASGKEILWREGLQASFTCLAFSPDGKMFASGSPEGTLRLWDVATATERLTRQGHQGAIFALTYSQDGRRIASAGMDTSILVWSVASDEKEASSPDVPRSEELETLCKELGCDDAKRAYWAIHRLEKGKDEAIRFLKDTLRIPDGNKAEIGRLIADLDHDVPDIREKAVLGLEKFGIQTAVSLRRALERVSSAEVQGRAREILDSMEGPILHSPDLLSRHRAIQILERVGTPAALEVLVELSEGSPLERERREAKAALERLKQLGK